MSSMETYGNRFAHVYDKLVAPLDPAGSELPWLYSILQSANAGPAPSIFEAGVGTGRILRPFVEHLTQAGHADFKVLGADRSTKMLQVFTDSGTSERITVVNADFSSRDSMRVFAESSADLVLCVGGTFSQLSGREAQQDALSEFARLLRPEGKIVLELHNPVAVRRMVEATEGKIFFPYPAPRSGLVWFAEITGDAWNLDEVWIEDGAPEVLHEQALLTAPETLEQLADAVGLEIEKVTAGVGSDAALTDGNMMYAMVLRHAGS